MQIRKRTLTKHRRQRLILWLLALLTWTASVLNGSWRVDFRHLRQRRPHLSLETLRLGVVLLIISRACELARMRGRPHVRYGRARMRRHFIRSLLGSRLRRVLQHRSAHQGVTNLIRALRNVDGLAVRLALRIRRRLTRLNAITAAPDYGTLLLGAPAPSPALANSS